VTYRWPRPQTLALTTVFAAAAASMLVFSRPVEMMVDGVRVTSDVPPVTTASREVFVPLRTIAEALGAEMIVERDGSISVVRGNQSLRLVVGKQHATLNAMPFTFHHAPFRVRGRVMVSLAAISRAFHVQAKYDARTARVDVTSPAAAPGTPN
jgi:hypothetical protein